MAQTLAQFKTKVSQAINRGDTLDAHIDTALQHAIEFIEQNNTLKYMERFVQFQIDPNLSQPRAISLPDEFVKSFVFVRIVTPTANGGDFHFIDQIDPQDSKYYDSGIPDHYWVDGVGYLWLDRVPAELYEAEMLYNRYTDYSTLTANSTHWLITRANGLLLAQTMIQMAPWMRNKEILQFYKELRGESLKTLLLADEEMRQSGRQSEVMRYGKVY